MYDGCPWYVRVVGATWLFHSLSKLLSQSEGKVYICMQELQRR